MFTKPKFGEASISQPYQVSHWLIDTNFSSKEDSAVLVTATPESPYLLKMERAFTVRCFNFLTEPSRIPTKWRQVEVRVDKI